MSDPIHIISLGAGVQSSTMALMAAAGEITPMPVAAIFADTQAEPKSVYTWLNWLETQLPFPVHRVTAGHLTADSLRLRTSKKSGKTYQKPSLPIFQTNAKNGVELLSRQCTLTYKIEPLQKALKRFVVTGKTVNLWMGISVDEISRCKDARKPWIKHIWPLIEKRMSRVDCLRWMQEHGFPKPPRSACVYCPFHNDAEWRRLKQDEPAAFKQAVAYEQQLQALWPRLTAIKPATPFLHRSCKPLDQVDFSTEEERGQLNMFNNECEGMCGV